MTAIQIICTKFRVKVCRLDGVLVVMPIKAQTQLKFEFYFKN